jgi:hypothetical protein
MNTTTATIADVENALTNLKAAVRENPSLQGLMAKKLAAAVDNLTQKSTVSGVFKRLQGNALDDFLRKQRKGDVGYTDENETNIIKDYVKNKFKSYMDDTKTSKEATDLFDKIYPPATTGTSNAILAEQVAE